MGGIARLDKKLCAWWSYMCLDPEKIYF